MRELSLHILDIVQNSIAAGSSLISIQVVENIQLDLFRITITDNGCGMSEEMVAKVCDPFQTSRTTRKVGLGLSLLKQAARACNGGMSIESSAGKGTIVKAWFQHKHIDRAPFGQFADTAYNLIIGNVHLDFIICHEVEQKNYQLDTREMRTALGGLDFNTPEVMVWIKEYFIENESNLSGGV